MSASLPLDTPFTDRSASGIAMAVGRLISTGELAVGSKLPTVRAVAKQLQVSPSTINDAWRILQGYGAIETDGRRGTFVRGPRQGAAPGRYWQVPVDPGTFAIDLSTGNPDPDLLPALSPILKQLTLDMPVTSYLDAPVLAELEQRLRATWPFPPELVTIVDGAQDGIARLVQTIANVGDVVAVNDPAFPPLLDMLDQAGARVIGLALDDEGVTPASLRQALEHEPVAIFLQPRAHNPTGIVMSEERSTELAGLLTNEDLIIVEDDHSAAVSGAPLATLGRRLPHKVVHVRSFSKSHGPDLRLAAVGGAAGPIDSVVRQRRLGPSWSSRLLQQILLTMLDDDVSIRQVAAAEDEYARRRTRFVAALADHGVTVRGSSGINVWIPVKDEQIAILVLAANGIGAAPGTPFRINPTADQHIRVSIGTVSENIDELAKSISQAAQAKPRGG